MSEKLIARDYRFILICVALTVLSLIIAAKYFYTAFPEASINFDVTREESRPLAEQFLSQRGDQFTNYRHGVIFGYDDQTKLFLEKEMGAKQANQLLGATIKLWRWQHRWFRPLQKEEFRVDVTTQGEIVGYEHLRPEEAPGANLASHDARAVADKFLKEVMKKDPAALVFVEAKSQQRPNRTDHTFTWEEPNFHFQGSSYRYEVTVQGDRIGGYSEFLKVPDKWIREYQKLRSLNHTAGTVDLALTVLLALGLLAVLIRHIRRGDIRWRTAVSFGLMAAGLDFLSSVNALPILEFDYTTTESYGGFLTSTVLSSLFNALLQGAVIMLITAAAEPLYRERFRDKISLSRLFSWRSLRTKRFFLSAVLGLTLAPCFIAYQTVFYLLANKQGAWAPVDVPYDELLNTSIPWVYVLLAGFFPAVSEEFMFRMFSLPFLERVFKSMGLALILAGFIWGFGHAEYPNQPFYIRGVEVGMSGIILGLVMLRFNILVTLIWHYTIDAGYTALLLLRSHNPYYILSGSLTAFIFLIPLLVALISYIRTGRFERETGLTNQTEIPPEIEPPEVVQAVTPVSEIGYQPLSGKRILWGCLMVGLLLSLYLLKTESFGEFVDFGVTRGQAQHIADEFLQARQVDPHRFRSVAYTESEFDPLVAKYIQAHADVKTLNEMFGRQLKADLWAVRYFKPLEKEEYRVYVDPQQKSVYTFEHIVAEEAPGADLTEPQAQTVATAFLKSNGINPGDYDLVESSSEKRPARRDYRLIWQARSGDPRNIGEAKFRLHLQLQGDEVSQFQRSLKVPESWERQRRQATTLTITRMGGQILLWGILGFFAISIFIGQARQGLIHWRRTVWLALGVAGIALLEFLNSLPLLYQDYDTSIEPTVFKLTTLAGYGMALVGILVGAAFGIGLGTTLYPEALRAWRRTNRARLGRDAAVSALLVIGAWLGLAQAADLLAGRFPAAAMIYDLSIPSDLDTALPAVSRVAAASLDTLLIVITLGLIIHVARRHLRKPIYLVLAVLAVLLVLVPKPAKTPGEFLFSLGILGLYVAAGVALIYGILRNNLLAYPVSVFLLLCFQSGYMLISQSARFFIINGACLLLGVAAMIGWLLWRPSQS
jgi:membrane protease YdiL (CAAX protease family)